MADNAIETSDTLLIDQENLGFARSPKSKGAHEDRIKHKAIRPSARLARTINGLADGTLDGDSPSVTVKGSNGGLKKYAKNSRRPRGRYGRGLPKKGGAGGKGTWGAPGSEMLCYDETPEDPHDPNYDSDSQDNCKFEAITPPLNDDEIEKFVSPIIAEYFEHGDTEEVLYSLEELNIDDNEYKVLVIAVTLAMDKKSSHREMTSVLISDFYGRVFSEQDIERGFDVLLKSLPDLVLDTPGAATILGNFIARAVADDCIPPAFVNRYMDSSALDEHAKNSIEHASALLNMKHGLVRLDTVWGVSGGMRPVKYLTRQIQLLLNEYISSGELDEAVQCLRELEVPHFHHEAVYEAVIMAVEDVGEKIQDLICKLLRNWTETALITVDQLKNGFHRVYGELDDIVIDVPLAYQNLERFVTKCTDFIPRELVSKCPSRGRKRFVSEGDGGRIKDE